MPTPTRTLEGKWLVWQTKDGQQLERWPVDAKLLLANGEVTLEPPEGVAPKLPPAPPRHVEIRPAAPAATFIAPSAPVTAAAGETVVVDTTKKGK